MFSKKSRQYVGFPTNILDSTFKNKENSKTLKFYLIGIE